MNKVMIVIMFILLGTSLIVVSNMGKGIENSYVIEYRNNKNLALPDLEEKQEISNGLYRIYNSNGITVDYNIFNGEITLNGLATAQSIFITLPMSLFETATYTIKYNYISGIMNVIGLRIDEAASQSLINRTPYNYTISEVKTFNKNNLNSIAFYVTNQSSFNNFVFTVQIEKGTQSTQYVVPKLIPVYKDNLTQQEKQEIGFGAFGGFSQIIKTIDNIIKPIGNFINGLLNLFN